MTMQPQPPRPPQPPLPPNNNHESIESQESHKKVVDDVWAEIGNEIEDDLGELPPPLPAHLLAERERYKQQNKPPQQAPSVPAPPPLPIPHAHIAQIGHQYQAQPPLPQQFHAGPP